MTPSPRGPLPDSEVDRLESQAFKGLLSNRMTPELKSLMSDFATYGKPGIDTIIDHFNDRLSRFYSPYRLGAEPPLASMNEPEVTIKVMRMENGTLQPTGALLQVRAELVGS